MLGITVHHGGHPGKTLCVIGLSFPLVSEDCSSKIATRVLYIQFMFPLLYKLVQHLNSLLLPPTGPTCHLYAQHRIQQLLIIVLVAFRCINRFQRMERPVQASINPSSFLHVLIHQALTSPLGSRPGSNGTQGRRASNLPREVSNGLIEVILPSTKSSRPNRSIKWTPGPPKITPHRYLTPTDRINQTVKPSS